MISKLSLTAATLAAAIFVATLPGSATTVGGLAPLKTIAGAQQSMVEKTFGWHRTCRRGLTDWHKHVPGVGRVTCTTKKCTVNRLGVRRCRWY